MKVAQVLIEQVNVNIAGKKAYEVFGPFTRLN